MSANPDRQARRIEAIVDRIIEALQAGPDVTDAETQAVVDLVLTGAGPDAASRITAQPGRSRSDIEALVRIRYTQSAPRRTMLDLLGEPRPPARRDGRRVFLSYRREGSVDLARHVAERLSRARNIGVFFDYKSLRAGPFPDAIERAVKQCDIFTLIVGPKTWARIDTPEDWVRREIELALDQQRLIIRLIGEGTAPDATPLPESIADIKRWNYIMIDSQNFEAAVQKLIDWISTAPPGSPRRLS